jgi:RNA polymerase sigma-70 factor, ECF subfamily
MRDASGFTTTREPTNKNRMQSCHLEVCEETGERLFRAGEYVAPGEYIEMETRRRIALTSPNFLPAPLDGKAACYRLVQHARRESGEQLLAERQAQFHALVARTHKRLYHYVRRSLHNSQDAEDLTQEVLARAWSYFETFDPQQSFDAWVLRIARNLLIDQSRRRKHRQEISLDAPVTELEGSENVCYFEIVDSTGDPESCLMTKEIGEGLQSTLSSLPTLHRQTLLLVAQQHSYEQIARVFNCSLGTVRSRIYRARAFARLNLKKSMLHEQQLR